MSTEVAESSQTVAAGQLRAFIERIEHLEEEKRTIVAMRRKDKAEREEAEAILDLYLAALGMA